MTIPDLVEYESDVAAALDAAQDAVAKVHANDHHAVVAVRRDYMLDTIDLDQFNGRPRRAIGRTISVTDADGFVVAVGHRVATDAENYPVLYADEAHSTLVAVLNDDGPQGPGWRDHRVALRLTPTEEWLHWKNRQGLHEQEHFATTIQEGAAEIVNPDAAVMLDIAQSFHASVSATVRSARRLRDGRTQVVYDENIDSSAGEDGTLTIPEVFELRMRPFYGSPLFEVTARLSYRLSSGRLMIGYQLHRPADIERAAFAQVVASVREGLSVYPVVAGTA